MQQGFNSATSNSHFLTHSNTELFHAFPPFLVPEDELSGQVVNPNAIAM